jgi:hypothetical protein
MKKFGRLMMSTNSNEWQMVLELDMGVGTLSIHRSKETDGARKFVLIRDESPIEESDEEVDWGLVREEYPPTDTFEEAIAEMNSYPWRDMLILTLHPDYEDIIMREMKLPRLPRSRG